MSVFELVEFERFFSMANFFWKSIGTQPYERSDGQRESFGRNRVYLLNVLNMNLVLLSEIAYVILAFRDDRNFLQATKNLSYIGYTIVSDVKIWIIWQQKHRLTLALRELRKLHPARAEEQAVYGVESHLRRNNLLSLGYASINLLLVWTYNLYSIVSYLIYDRWLKQRVVQQALPYFAYVPWDWRGHWTYYLLYASQNLGGHTCIAGQVGGDILLFAIATQIIMHHQCLARRIGDPSTGKKRADDRLKFLEEVVVYHRKLLHLINMINDIFGLSLLVNFISSCLIICVLGFDVTIGLNPDKLFMSSLFLFATLMQIFTISKYAQDLITASENIAHAVYNHNWIGTDTRYQKMLVLLIARAQKPALLRATRWLHISFGTMTALIQISYKFFALLRTIYQRRDVKE